MFYNKVVNGNKNDWEEFTMNNTYT
ncbi:universal stress protein UspA, partial [Bacillus thuringiensis]